MDKVKSTPRDVFMYLLGTATLYWSAFNFGRLVFSHIDIAFPDPLQYYGDPAGGMRFAIASLIIVFPVYLIITRLLNREIVVSPEKAEIRIRKWLVYLTLFIAGLLIIGDLVAVIYNFLEGDLTARFLLKVGTILAIAGTVFGYYLTDLRKDRKESASRARIFGIVSSVAVIAAVVYGFFVAGSPFKQRLVRFDSQKVSDLQTIQWQIVNYWQSKEKLPAQLTDLEDSITGFKVPIDPQTPGTAYGYTVKGPRAFELCADFNLAATESNGVYSRPEPIFDPGMGQLKGTWDHPEGRYCFDRTIDPDLFPVKPKQ